MERFKLSKPTVCSMAAWMIFRSLSRELSLRSTHVLHSSLTCAVELFEHPHVVHLDAAWMVAV